MALRRNPIVYEINTWVWLTELTERCGRPITLGNVPSEIYDELVSLHPDTVWLMGVWERSPRGREIALHHPDLQFEFQRVLPDFKPEDVVGSPYAIHRYVVDEHLGGPDGLAEFRAQLHQRGISLILDYVPNHVAVDHPWTIEHPACLVHGTPGDLKTRPTSFYQVPENGEIIAHGRDPNWPAWTDTAQVNAFSREGREQSLATLMNIAQQCDGIRCDMAMLMVNRIFSQTWSWSDIPSSEFWQDIIPPIKQDYPNFVFMAEVYWEMEAELQALGFDYTYDKRLYDRLLHDSNAAIRDHLLAATSYQRRMVRFVENHDEARAMSSFGFEKSLAAATLMVTLPGARMIHEGQCEGRKVRIPVQLGHRPAEKPVEQVQAFYQKLTAEVGHAAYHEGTFMMLASHPILGDDAGHENLFTFAWALAEDWRIVVVNYSDQAIKGRIMLPRPEFGGLAAWSFEDALNPGNAILHIGDDLLTSGLPIELPAWGAYLFSVSKG